MPPLPDHYAVLQVHRTASAAQIKAAYLRQVSRWHPDRNPSPEATRRTAQINAAWEVLGDVARRAAYDKRLLRPRTTAAPAGTPNPVRRNRPPEPPRARADPAAAERARRAAEASAREAEARRQRDAEFERRRTASEHLWQPPPEGALGWSDPDFMIGHWYRSNLGPYKVVDLRDRWVDIYYTDGNIVTLRREDLWRHWQQQVQRRRRGSQAARSAR